MAKAVRIATAAKAGRRSVPPVRGSQMTTIEDRKRGLWLSKFGFKFFAPLYPAQSGGKSNA